MRVRRALPIVVALAVGWSVTTIAATGVNRPARVVVTARRVDRTVVVPDPLERTRLELQDLLNQFRARHGHRPLTSHHALTAAAQRHADELAGRRVMTHVGLNGWIVTQRVAAEGFVGRAAENLGRGYLDPAAVLAGWIASPPHAPNLLLDFEYVGIGIGVADGVTPYWVLVVGTTR